MSFEKKEWKYKDTITAEDLNRFEDGVEEALSKGYNITISEEVIFDGSIPFSAERVFANTDIEDAIKSTFDSLLPVWYDGNLVGESVSWSYQQDSLGSYYRLYLDYDNNIYINYHNSTQSFTFFVNGINVDIPNSHTLKMTQQTIDGSVTNEFIAAVNMVLGNI